MKKKYTFIVGSKKQHLVMFFCTLYYLIEIQFLYYVISKLNASDHIHVIIFNLIGFLKERNPQVSTEKL